MAVIQVGNASEEGIVEEGDLECIPQGIGYSERRRDDMVSHME